MVLIVLQRRLNLISASFTRAVHNISFIINNQFIIIYVTMTWNAQITMMSATRGVIMSNKCNTKKPSSQCMHVKR